MPEGLGAELPARAADGSGRTAELIYVPLGEQAGTREYARFFADNRAYAWSIAYDILRHREDTEDAISIASWPRAFYRDDILNNPTIRRPKPYYGTMVGSSALDIYNRRARREAEEGSFEDEIISSDAFEGDVADAVPAGTCLDLCLQRLGPEGRRLLMARHVEVQPITEMASSMNSSTGALHGRLHRARVFMRQCVEECESDG